MTPSFFSYGFRPFFLGAALFAGVAIPVVGLDCCRNNHPNFLYAPREWHVHEMFFGFLPAVIAGFLLHSDAELDGASSDQGNPLMVLWALWLAGRLVIAIPWPSPLSAPSLTAPFLWSGDDCLAGNCDRQSLGSCRR